MKKNYSYRVYDVEHPGDYEPHASAIRSGGGSIISIDWTEYEDTAIIRFSADPNDIPKIKSLINELL